jgi:hypothetical protein
MPQRTRVDLLEILALCGFSILLTVKEEAKALVYEDHKRFISKKMDDSLVVDPYIETVEQQVNRNKYGRFPDMGT